MGAAGHHGESADSDPDGLSVGAWAFSLGSPMTRVGISPPGTSVAIAVIEESQNLSYRSAMSPK